MWWYLTIPVQADSPYNRPVDKRENYIKRCQATPGDTLSIVNAQVYVNGKARPNTAGWASILYCANGRKPDQSASISRLAYFHRQPIWHRMIMKC